jgi:hypothetical protein
MSTHDSASRKPSRWASTHPTRSGYLEHGSRGENNDIQLTDHDAKNNHVHVIGGGSSSGSTIGLNNDWDQEKDPWNKSSTGSVSNNMGILKTVKITQL